MDDGGALDRWREEQVEKRLRDEEDPEGSGLPVLYPDGTWDYEGGDPYQTHRQKEAEAARQREMAVLRHKRMRAQLKSQRESDHYYDEDVRLQADILSGRTQLGRYDLDLLGVPPHPSVGLLGKEGMPYNPREFRHLR